MIQGIGGVFSSYTKFRQIFRAGMTRKPVLVELGAAQPQQPERARRDRGFRQQRLDFIQRGFDSLRVGQVKMGLAGAAQRHDEFVHPLSAGGHRGSDRNAKRLFDRPGVKRQAAGVGFVHHIERQRHGTPHLGQLDGQMQRAAQVFCVADL